MEISHLKFIMTQFLNLRNIQQSTGNIEYHPLLPFIHTNTRVLFLGSFPPQRKRWCINFFYPNFINDHWRIQGIVFYDNKDAFLAEGGKSFDMQRIVHHCESKGLGYFDTATAVRRLNDNASDKFLEVVQPTDIRKLVSKATALKAIVTTGEKATETICNYFALDMIPKVEQCVPLPDMKEVVLYRLPSSSRAYPMPLQIKAEAYKRMFQQFL